MRIKIRKNKLVVDILRNGKLAICFCWRHLKIWLEGDLYEENGGGACKLCSERK